MTDTHDVGREVRREVLGDAHVERADAATTPFTAAFQEFITRYAWGDVWDRPGLDRRTRSCVTLAVLTALRAESELALHVAAGLRNGLSPDEIAEVFLHTAVYAGVPAANTAFAIAQRALDDAPRRRLVSSGSPYEGTIGFSRAARVGPVLAVSGTAPIWPDGHVDPDPLAQARRCWEIALDALAQAGGRPADVVRTRTYLTGPEHEAAAARAHAEQFAELRPASTMVVVSALLDPRWVVEVELDAVVDER